MRDGEQSEDSDLLLTNHQKKKKKKKIEAKTEY